MQQDNIIKLVQLYRNIIKYSYRLQMGNQNGTPVLRQEDIEALQASSQLTEEQVGDSWKLCTFLQIFLQIRDAFNNFMKEHPNGKINKAAFAQMMEKAMPDKDAKKMDKHIFRVYDTNNDGVIDFTEFMVRFKIRIEKQGLCFVFFAFSQVVFHMVSEGSPEDILTKLFRVFDVNG